MNIKEIKEFLQLMKEHDLSEIEIEKDGLKIKLKKSKGGEVAMEEVEHIRAAMPVTQTTQGVVPVAVEEKPQEKDPNMFLVKSPMVGTFYGAPTPDQPPYVSVGQKVLEGDVLCIVEAMKLMNEIKSEASGTITEIMVQNGKPVEFDQLLFKIKTG